MIDSQDSDPVYNSDPEYGRFYFLRWNEPGSYDHRSQKYFGADKPRIPVVYMADYPAGAFLTGTGARNVALEFNTCIYKAHDVPEETRRDDIDFARSIICFEWQNVYVYDFDKGQFQTQLAGVPWWEEPGRRIDRYPLVLFVILFFALALVALLRFGKFPRRRDRS